MSLSQPSVIGDFQPLQSKSTAVLCLIIGLGLLLFLFNVHFHLASDDLDWLQGRAPTVFDQYRIIPRALFMLLDMLFGPSPIAALSMIFLFHSLNTLLIYALAKRLIGHPLASLATAAIFSINPLTLTTLTWISCFSYILGACLALLALLFFVYRVNHTWPAQGALLTLLCYLAGLFSSHEILFLPVLFLLFGCWLGGQARRRGAYLAATGFVAALVVYLAFYNFERYGVDPGAMLTVDFLGAYFSSLFAFGFSLLLAYPLSFFSPALEFLKICFSGPVRWSITWALLAFGIILFRNTPRWKSLLVLSGSCAALFTPYILRVALMPDSINYHISYILTGRVFYVPFIGLALLSGWCVSCLPGIHSNIRSVGLLLGALFLLAYFYGLLAVYRPSDFMGLSVIQGSPTSLPPPWNPYQGDSPYGLLVAASAAAIAFCVRPLLSDGQSC